MNYLTLWKVNVLISFLILIEGCLCCQVLTDRPIEELLGENDKSPWLVFIVDLTSEAAKTRELAAQAYGSLIHPKLALTAGYSIANSEIENLRIRTKCTATNKYVKCSSRRVIDIIDSSRLKKKEKMIEDWVILMTEVPFVASERVNFIKLAYDYNTYDKACQIYHLLIMPQSNSFDYSTTTQTITETKLLHFPYNVTLNADGFELSEEDQIRMQYDIDCLIENCFEDRYEDNDLARKLSFMGSPIVCQDEDGTPVQVGFTTVVYELIANETSRVRQLSGSFVRFDSYDESVFTNMSRTIFEKS